MGTSLAKNDKVSRLPLAARNVPDSPLEALIKPVLAVRLPASGVPVNRRFNVPSTPAIGSEAYQALPQGWPSIQRSKVTPARGLTRL